MENKIKNWERIVYILITIEILILSYCLGYEVANNRWLEKVIISINPNLQY